MPFPRFVVFYNGEEDIPEELYLRLSDAFDERDEEPAVECVARFVNINYGHNQELLDNCKRLHDYSYFVACVRGYLKEGYGQKEAVIRATDECIKKGILKDVLVKHRAEVVDMFLTTFDKKMYKEALLEEGEKNKLISQVKKKLAKGKTVEVIADEVEENVDTVIDIIKELQK